MTEPYDPVECLREEVKRFKSTNTFSPMLVTNFYAQAACVLDELVRVKADLAEANQWRERHSSDAAAYGKQSQQNWEKANALEKENADLKRDKERLTQALDRIGFFFVGHEQYGHVADKCLLVLGGKTIHEAIKQTAAQAKAQS